MEVFISKPKTCPPSQPTKTVSVLGPIPREVLLVVDPSLENCPTTSICFHVAKHLDRAFPIGVDAVQASSGFGNFGAVCWDKSVFFNKVLLHLLRYQTSLFVYGQEIWHCGSTVRLSSNLLGSWAVSKATPRKTLIRKRNFLFQLERFQIKIKIIWRRAFRSQTTQIVVVSHCYVRNVQSFKTHVLSYCSAH